jgi:DNA-binding transcriptional LysR family regulator
VCSSDLIIPTKEAEVLYKHSLELIEGVDALKESITGKELTGKLILGASTIPGAYILPHIISGFQKNYPAISAQITVSDSKGIVDSISKRELFLGIVGARFDDDQIEYTSYMEDELIVVSSPSPGKW